MNVPPDDIFWTAELFVIKLAVVMHHHEPDCQSELKNKTTEKANKRRLIIFRIKVTMRAHKIKLWLFIDNSTVIYSVTRRITRGILPRKATYFFLERVWCVQCQCESVKHVPILFTVLISSPYQRVTFCPLAETFPLSEQIYAVGNVEHDAGSERTTISHTPLQWRLQWHH